MAKAKQTTKKAVASNKSTPSKAVAKKAVVKAPAKKATPAPAKKAVVAKKAAPAPAKKVAPAKKTATVQKAVPVAKKATTVKKVTAPAKKTATVAKKAVPVKKVAPVKTAPTSKKVTESVVKKAAPQKATKEAASAKIQAKKVVKASSLAKSKMPKEPEIVDAIAKKSDLKQAKPGAIALRDLDRGQNKKKNTEEEKLENFNPTRTSILNETENIGPAFRYSEEDLNEFREIILKRLDVARENLNYYQALMARKDESGTDDTDNRFNSMEDGSGAMEREQLSQLAARQMQFIDHLEKAIVRIENKTYGVCRVTGKLIDKARLKAVPHATLSMEAKTSRR